MDGQENTNNVTEVNKQTTGVEAKKILANPVIAKELNADVLKEKGILQKISDATHYSIKALSLAFAMLLATEAKEAIADNIPKEPVPTLMAKAEQVKTDQEKMKAEKITISADLQEISKGDETMTDYLGTIDNYNKVVEKKDKLDKNDLIRLDKVGKILVKYSSIKQNPDPGGKADIKFDVNSVGPVIADLAFLATLEPMEAQPGSVSASADFDNVK